MIDRSSKLFVQHPNILQEATDYALPVLWTDKKKKLPKEKSSQIGILLNRLTKQRMIGSIIEQTRSRKYSPGKRKVNSSASQYQTQRKSCRKNTSIDGPETFISAFDGSMGTKTNTKQTKITLSPNRTRLPSISSPRQKPKQVSKFNWQKFSKQGRLKKDLFLSFLSKKTFPTAAETFIRFFQPPFQSACFKFNQFLVYLCKLSEMSKKFFEFQMLDIDNDGIISPKDILDIYMTLTESSSCNQQFRTQIDKLSMCIKHYSELDEKPKPNRTLFETVICDRNSTVEKLASLVDPQYKNEGLLKQYVHTSAYRHTFLMFGHNGKMRARTELIEQAKSQMNKLNFKNQKGLSFGVYAELPLNFVGILVEIFSQRDEEFNLVLK